MDNFFTNFSNGAVHYHSPRYCTSRHLLPGQYFSLPLHTHLKPIAGEGEDSGQFPQHCCASRSLLATACIARICTVTLQHLCGCVLTQGFGYIRTNLVVPWSIVRVATSVMTIRHCAKGILPWTTQQWKLIRLEICLAKIFKRVFTIVMNNWFWSSRLSSIIQRNFKYQDTEFLGSSLQLKL